MVFVQIAPFPAEAITQSEVTSKLNTITSSQTGKTWSTGPYSLGSQCYGFAHNTFNTVFSRGKTLVGSYTSPNQHILNNRPSDIVQIASLSSSQTTVSAVKTALQKALPGDYIQLKRASGGPHSIIVTSVTSDKINYIDANSDGKNTIKTHSLTFAQFEAANQSMSIYRHNSYTTSLSSSISSNLVKSINSKMPMQAYIPSTTTRVNTYSSIGGKWDGYSQIYVSDLCTLHQVYDSGWLKVSYPTSKGTKTAYCKTSDFFPAGFGSVTTTKLGKNITTYKKSNGTQSFGSIYSTDTITKLGKSGSYTQVIYPVSGSVKYKLAWVKI